jgi:hypothetical protein
MHFAVLFELLEAPCPLLGGVTPTGFHASAKGLDAAVEIEKQINAASSEGLFKNVHVRLIEAINYKAVVGRLANKFLQAQSRAAKEEGGPFLRVRLDLVGEGFVFGIRLSE